MRTLAIIVGLLWAWFFLAFLLADLSLGNTISGATISGARIFVNETALPDWGDNMLGWWTLDEGGTTDRVAGGTCGAGANMVETGSIPNSTSIYQEGTASNDWSISEADYLNCTDANCSCLERAGSGDHSLTFGCWLRSVLADSTVLYVMSKQSAGILGFLLKGNAPAATCAIDAIERAGTSLTNSEWFHLVCVFDDNANTLKTCVDASCSATSTALTMTETSVAVEIGALAGTTGMYGQVDECFDYAGAMAVASLCRICSCGISGSLCKCGSGVSATTFVSTGRNSTECGSCSLPTDCSAAAPS